MPSKRTCWAVIRRTVVGSEDILINTIRRTKREAIEAYEYAVGPRSDAKSLVGRMIKGGHVRVARVEVSA